jgi:transcriptional regulator with XRE-family HTH domain
VTYVNFIVITFVYASKLKLYVMKDRLLKFLNREQLSSARFAEVINVQPSSVSHILSGRNKPGFDFIQKILTGYPSINAEWLITGKGSMYKGEIRQGSLFPDDRPAYPADPDPPGEDVTGIYEGRNEAENTAVTNVYKNEESIDYNSKLSNPGQITNVNKDKSITKIVIFYSDRSFSEYNPE